MPDFRKSRCVCGVTPWIVCGILSVGALTGMAAEESARGFRGPEEMEAFVNGLIAAQRESLHIAGAVVTVVSDGKVYFSKGYGYADIGKRRPVDPEKTLFRIGSVTKLFTWTAVMQLVEQGKLSLDTDVNTFLRAMRVPATFPKPITLTHLLTHTPGFEDRVLGLFSYDPASVKPLAETLATQLPARVRPPGQFSVYSNHGSALAGLAVQEVAATTWEEYVEKKILEPLQMTNVTPRQPVPAAFTDNVAVGYRFVEGDFQPTGFEYIPIPPAGCMSASGESMARFMIAHLQHGQLGDVRILAEPTARLMHSRLFSNAPGIDGMLHGFCEMNQNGERIFGHGGGMLCFFTLLALMPERNIGVFVSYNSDTGARALQHFWNAFLNHYFPPPALETPKPAKGAAEKLGRLTGEYSSLRRSTTSLTKLAALLGTVKVRVDPEGYLVTTGMGESPRRWVEVEPSVFREVAGTKRVAFRVDDVARTAYLFPDFPAATLVRHRWHETTLFHFGLLGGALLVLASAIFFWPVVAFCSRAKPRSGSPPRMARLSAWIMSVLFGIFFLFLAQSAQDTRPFVFGVPLLVQRALWLPFVAAFFAALTGFFMLRSWGGGYWGFLGRVHYFFVFVAGVVLLWWMYDWKLLGFHFN